MKIGITEAGDAGLDFSWYVPVAKKEVDGAILITKNINEEFIKKVLELQSTGCKIIVHCTCTGYGSTKLEPNVPDFKRQLNSLADLIDRGFEELNCVLRIDPIFPTERGLERVRNVLEYSCELGFGFTRIRISILDEYKHVKERFRSHGWKPIYGDNFQASEKQLHDVINVLSDYAPHYEVCAEEKLFKLAPIGMFERYGCVSHKDLGIFAFGEDRFTVNPQNRKGCCCLSCKTELLNNKKQCQHKCVYCYWH